jgi:hypothetical protein
MKKSANNTTPPALDPSTAVERPHTQLFAHAATGRTVGYQQPDGDGLALFGLQRTYIATVPAAEVPAIIPPEVPPPAATA